VTAAAGTSFDVTCPHCKKAFEAALIEGPTPRYSGFKCPHCKLFVPYERADDQNLVDPA
jgi:phage FluMu protein Com